MVFVFLFLAALYESWSVPFSVLLAVPVGIFGAILALFFLPKLTNNVYAQIGMITLIGLSAKNAILIMEFAKERVDKGMPLVEATLEAVRLRLRPIIMTSLAFILGIAPLTFASGAGAEARQTMGWTVLGGMLAATCAGHLHRAGALRPHHPLRLRQREAGRAGEELQARRGARRPLPRKERPRSPRRK